MTITPHLSRVFSAIALIAFSSYAAAFCNGGYRWSEVKSGKTITHYTQQPPEGRASECVSVSTGTRTQVNPSEGDTSANLGEKPATEDKPAQPNNKPKGIEALPNKDPEKCKQAQETKTVLDSHARIREKGDNGEYRYLSPDEIAEQKKLAEESTGIYCE